MSHPALDPVLNVGDPASTAGCQHVTIYTSDVLTCEPLPANDAADWARDWLLNVMPSGTCLRGSNGSPLQPFADLLGVEGEWLANRDQQLGLHYDVTGPDAASNTMILWSEGCAGGEVCFPDLGIAVVPRGTVRFAGREVLHGVAPFTLAEDGYRLSVVFYAPGRRP